MSGLAWWRRLFSSGGGGHASPVRLSVQELYDLVKHQLERRFHDMIQIRLSDHGFVPVEDAQVRSWMDAAAVFYVPETRDCDDLAFILKARACEAAYRDGVKAPYAFGIVYTTVPNHAFNWYLDTARRVRFVDVQLGVEVVLRGEITLLVA